VNQNAATTAASSCTGMENEFRLAPATLEKPIGSPRRECTTNMKSRRSLIAGDISGTTYDEVVEDRPSCDGASYQDPEQNQLTFSPFSYIIQLNVKSARVISRLGKAGAYLIEHYRVSPRIESCRYG